MNKLEEMYNWNGIYKAEKSIDKLRFKVSDTDYPEYLNIFIEDNGNIRYSIIDEKFGFPALANTHNGDYSIKARAKAIKILDTLEKEGFISKID